MDPGKYYRPRCKTYNFHCRIPDDVVVHFGKGKATLKTFSLKTRIERLALPKAREHAVRICQDHPAFDDNVISFNDFVPLRHCYGQARDHRTCSAAIVHTRELACDLPFFFCSFKGGAHHADGYRA